jgi:Glycosyl hydrolase family 20, domain 2
MSALIRVSLLLHFLITVFSCNTAKQDDSKSPKVDIIPSPEKVLQRDGLITLTSDIWVVADVSDSVSAELASYLVGSLKTLTGNKILITDLFSTRKHNQSIQIELARELKATENGSYDLIITSGQIKIKANSADGIFYGIQTLMQLLRANRISDSFILQKMIIKDSPKYYMRGIIANPSQLDATTCRNLLESMTRLKLNTIYFTEDSPLTKSVAELVTKNHIQCLTHRSQLNEMILLDLDASSEEFAEIFPEIKSGRDINGMMLDLNSTSKEDFAIKLVMLAEHSWSGNGKKDVLWLKQQASQLKKLMGD